jgi:hypothetical protein
VLVGLVIGSIALRTASRATHDASTFPVTTLGALLGGGAIGALWYGWSLAGGSLPVGLHLLAVFAAAASLGGLVGFLFGIPRLTYSGGVYRPSTNLDDVADWLTKIIVGLGLTQLGKAGDQLNLISENALAGCSTPCPAKGFVGGLLLFGLASGFLFGYVWTRLHYGSLAARADKEIRDTLAAEKEAIAEHDVGGQVTEKNQEIAGADLVKAKAGLPGATDDPNKGLFGGSPVAKGRVLVGSVKPSESNANWFRVHLQVLSFDPDRPLRGAVDFHLHPTFRNPVVTCSVDRGVATLTVVAYGAFTVGAVADSGDTRLELDLASLPDAPAQFKAL